MDCFSEYIINKPNLLHNVKYIKNKIGENVKLCAVVKCDAYGLGIENVVPIIDNEVDFYAVANCKEGMNLRLFTSKPILILGQVETSNILLCIKNNLSITVDSIEVLYKILCLDIGGTLKVHIKINTGMNRYGINNIEELSRILKVIKSQRNIILEGIYTHFATSEKNTQFIKKQHNLFEKIIKNVKNKKILVHCCSSFGTLKCGNFLHDMVRVGFALYSKTNYDNNLRNVVSIKSQLTHIQKLNKGESVGYECSFVADKDMKIGVVPYGYGDGFLRALSNLGFVLIKGVKANVIGKVCMDAMIVDLTDIDDVQLYDRVTILGCDFGKEIDVFTWSNLLDSSPYEMLTNLKHSRIKTTVVDE